MTTIFDIEILMNAYIELGRLIHIYKMAFSSHLACHGCQAATLHHTNIIVFVHTGSPVRFNHQDPVLVLTQRQMKMLGLNMRHVILKDEPKYITIRDAIENILRAGNDPYRQRLRKQKGVFWDDRDILVPEEGDTTAIEKLDIRAVKFKPNQEPLQQICEAIKNSHAKFADLRTNIAHPIFLELNDSFMLEFYLHNARPDLTILLNTFIKHIDSYMAEIISVIPMENAPHVRIILNDQQTKALLIIIDGNKFAARGHISNISNLLAKLATHDGILSKDEWRKNFSNPVDAVSQTNRGLQEWVGAENKYKIITEDRFEYRLQPWVRIG